MYIARDKDSHIRGAAHSRAELTERVSADEGSTYILMDHDYTNLYLLGVHTESRFAIEWECVRKPE